MMSVMNQYLSLGRDFTFAWAMFLEAFKTSESENKLGMVNVPPDQLDLDQNTLSFITLYTSSRVRLDLKFLLVCTN